ncbi:MAG: HAD family hydrolase [Candidatus Aenigmatarchaeota archaeon]
MIVIIDLDGVLIDNLIFEEKVLEYFFKRISKKYKVSLKEAKKIFFKFAEKLEGTKEWHDWRIFSRELKLGKTWKEAHLKNLKYLKLIKGSKKFLLKLKKDEHKLILASDAIKPIIKMKIGYFELEKFFDDIVSQDDTKCIKSDTKFFEFILKKWKEPKENFIIIDNRLDRGILTGKRLGIKTIFIKRLEHSHKYVPLKEKVKPDFSVKKLSEAYKIIKRISMGL